METVRCTISTLTPVHIGCGEDYYPTNYVIDDGFLHCFGEDGLLTALDFIDKQRLAKLAEEQGDEGLKKLQAFIYNKKEQLQYCASHHVPVSKELEKFYQSRIGRTSQREGNGRNVNNQLAIARHAFNPYSQTPYFPGSSIKGAIRTALLNAENNGNRLPFRTHESRDIPKGEADKLQKRLLNYQSISDKPEKGIKGDPLRLLKISDANYSAADLYGLEIRFAVNRKNKPSKEKSQAEQRGLYQLLECLPAHRSNNLAFDVTFLTGEKRACFADIQAVAKSCNDFFLPQFKKELAILQQLNYANAAWLKGLEKLLAGELGEALKNNQAFLLRIGQHGGAESNTLEGVRHIKIMQGKNPAKYLDKPTTIWLAGDNKDQQHNLLPFGWILVEINHLQLPQTAEFLTQQAQADYQKQAQIEQLEAQRIEFLKKRHIEQEMKAKQQAEAEEKARLEEIAEEEKQKKLISMSDTQKQIFELQQQLENIDNDLELKNPNGVLRQQLTATIKQATDWSNEDKQALLEVARKLIDIWGLKKNKKVKDQLKSLES